MGWDAYYRRVRAIDAVLDRAGRVAEYDLSWQRHPEIPEVFGTTEDFVAALRYKWSMLWTGYFDAEQLERGEDLEAARAGAMRACVAAQPTLWRLLQQNESGRDVVVVLPVENQAEIAGARIRCPLLRRRCA